MNTEQNVALATAVTNQIVRQQDLITKMEWCIKEVLEWHSNPDSPEYNECDKEPCYWCSAARGLISLNR